MANSQWTQEDIRHMQDILSSHQSITKALRALRMKRPELFQLFKEHGLGSPTRYLATTRLSDEPTEPHHLPPKEPTATKVCYKEGLPPWPQGYRQESVFHKKPFYTILVGNDFHVPFHHKKAVENWLQVAKDLQPDVIVINGDFLDCYSISSFSKAPGAPNLQAELDAGAKILQKLRHDCPNSKIYYLEGNHEERLKRHLVEFPGLYGLRDLALEKLLRLDDLDIQFLPYKDILNLGSLCITHGEGRGSSIAGQTARNYMEKKGFDHIIIGHVHKIGHIHKTGYKRHQQSLENGCLLDIEQADYISQPNWQMGFCLAYQGTGENPWVQMQSIAIQTDGSFVCNGKYYPA